MAKTFSKLPSDPWFETINPLMYSFMYLSWIRDQEEEHKFAEDYSILTGSFSNPHMAAKMRDQSQNHQHMVSSNVDQLVEQTEELLLQHLEGGGKKKKRKKLKRAY